MKNRGWLFFLGVAVSSLVKMQVPWGITLFSRVGLFNDPSICQLYFVRSRTKEEYSFIIHICRLIFVYLGGVMLLELFIINTIIGNIDMIRSVFAVHTGIIRYSYWH